VIITLQKLSCMDPVMRAWQFTTLIQNFTRWWKPQRKSSILRYVHCICRRCLEYNTTIIYSKNTRQECLDYQEQRCLGLWILVCKLDAGNEINLTSLGRGTFRNRQQILCLGASFFFFLVPDLIFVPKDFARVFPPQKPSLQGTPHKRASHTELITSHSLSSNLVWRRKASSSSNCCVLNLSRTSEFLSVLVCFTPLPEFIHWIKLNAIILLKMPLPFGEEQMSTIQHTMLKLLLQPSIYSM